jgi:ribosomal protein L11 methyltransferase
MFDSVRPPKSSEPYQELYIYLINGVVSARDEAGFGNEFLGTWVEGETSFLFFPIPSREKVHSLIMDRPELSLFEEHHFSYEEWQGTRLEPIRISKFLIVPPWNSEAAGEGEVRMILDPGVVFGTGLHPTTGGCLQALAYLRKQFAFERVVDLGTGTGVLAVAAASLGARRVLAVDLNPLCVRTAKQNVRHNRQEDAVEVVEGKAEDFTEEHVDLVVANLHYDALITLLEKESVWKKEWIILSGLMRSQARDIKIRLEKYGLTIVQEWDDEGTWTTMLVKGAPWPSILLDQGNVKGQNPNAE